MAVRRSLWLTVDQIIWLYTMFCVDCRSNYVVVHRSLEFTVDLIVDCRPNCVAVHGRPVLTVDVIVWLYMAELCRL